MSRNPLLNCPDLTGLKKSLSNATCILSYLVHEAIVRDCPESWKYCTFEHRCGALCWGSAEGNTAVPSRILQLCQVSPRRLKVVLD